MRPYMRLEHAIGHERLVALHALVRLLARVRADVLLKMTRLLEAPVAVCAAIGPVEASLVVRAKEGFEVFGCLLD